MTKIKFSLLAYLYVLAGFISYLALSFFQRLGGTPPFLHPLVSGVEALVAVGILWGGWQVRKLRDGKISKLELCQAPLVLASAQMGAIWSSLFLGYLSGFSLFLIQLRHSQYLWDYGLRIILFAVVTLILLVVSLMVEKWCENDDKDSKIRKTRNLKISHILEEQGGCAARKKDYF